MGDGGDGLQGREREAAGGAREDPAGAGYPTCPRTGEGSGVAQPHAVGTLPTARLAERRGERQRPIPASGRRGSESGRGVGRRGGERRRRQARGADATCVMCMKIRSYLRVGVALGLPAPARSGGPRGPGAPRTCPSPPPRSVAPPSSLRPPDPPEGARIRVLLVRVLPARAAPGSGLGGEGGVGAQLPGAQVDARVPHLLGVQPLLGPHQHLHPPGGPREPVSE